MPVAMKYLFNIAVVLIVLAVGVFNLQAQHDSVLVSQKLMGPDDLVFHIDSFKTKVIAASRSTKNIEDLPFTIYVITHEEIINNHYVTLADLLKSLPGIRVSQPGNGELGEIFLLRNLAGNYYTKILLDGMPVKPSVVGGMPIGGQLPVRQAERIEIVYGPAASIYGADAASGVINIITKEAEKGTFARADILFGQNEYSSMNYMIGGKAGKNRNLLQYSFYGSKTDFNNINIKHSLQEYYNPLEYYQRKGKEFLIGEQYYKPIDINEDILRENNIQSADFMSANYPVNYTGNLTYTDTSAELSTGDYMIGINLKFRGISLSYNNMYRRTHSSIGNSSFFYRYNDPLAYWGERIQRSTLGYTLTLGNKLSSASNLSYLAYRMDNNSSQSPTFIPGIKTVYLYAASDDILVEEILTYTPVLNLEILGGISYQASSNLPKTNILSDPFARNTYKPFGNTSFPTDSLMKNFGYHTLTFQNFSAFAQAYWIYRRLRLMLGVRYDYNSLYGDNLNPRIALMYCFPKTSVRASAGTATKVPPASVAYESLAYPTATIPDSIMYLVIPNPNLKSERFNAFEFSISRRLFKRIQVELAVYYNSVTNLINFNAFIPCPDTLPFSCTDSVSTKLNDQYAKSVLYGAQINLNWNDIIPSIKLSASASLTFNEVKRKNFSAIDEVFDVFNFTPTHYGQCRITASPIRNMYLQFDNTWMTEWKTEWMQLFTQTDWFESVTGYYTLDFMVDYNIGTNLKAFIKVYNIFNEKYATPNIIRSERDMISIPQPGRNIRFGLTYTLN